MVATVHDASHLVTLWRPGICLVCREPLGVERHWIVSMPDGEHDRCRDWTRYPCPFRRHVPLLRRLWRVTPLALRPSLTAVGKIVTEMVSTWPRDADAVLVADTFRRMRELRTALLAEGVDKKLCAQI